MSVVDELERVTNRRLGRLLTWASVGAVGMVIDLSVTVALLGTVHYLLANVAGFALAVSLNFAGNWTVTYRRPEGSIAKQYVSYVALHAVTFGFRAATIALLVAGFGVGAQPATIVGVGVAAAANFVGTERIFGGIGDVWFDFVEAANHIAHAVWSSRLRGILMATQLYDLVFLAYAHSLSLAYRDDTRTIRVGEASGQIPTERAVETLSVLHTVEQESDVLEAFVEDVKPEDHVLDVGANLGVWSVLAGDCGASVTAVEPHRPTAQRCEATLRENRVSGAVHAVALGANPGTAHLAVTEDKVGTQRGEIGDTGEYEVQVRVGDELPHADIVKIDVEGAESAVLAGLSETLAAQRPRVIYVEAHSDELAADVNDILTTHGYCVARLSDGEEVHLRATNDPSQRGEDQIQRETNP